MRDQKIADNVAAVSRRKFAGSIVAAAAIALFPETVVGDDEKAQDSGTYLGAKPEDLSVEDWNEVRARYSNVLRVYGERLSSREKHSVARILTTNQHMLASIRSFVVQNGDPSACTLRVYDQSSTHAPANGI
jgi:hypothetical protein